MNLHLSSFIKELPWDVFVVFHGNSEILRNGDVHFPFRQDSDFLYLTGMSSPDIILTIYWSELIFWREPISEKDTLWWHSKYSDENIIITSGISDIRDRKEFEEYYKNHLLAETHQKPRRNRKNPKSYPCFTWGIWIYREKYQSVNVWVWDRGRDSSDIPGSPPHRGISNYSCIRSKFLYSSLHTTYETDQWWRSCSHRCWMWIYGLCEWYYENFFRWWYYAW